MKWRTLGLLAFVVGVTGAGFGAWAIDATQNPDGWHYALAVWAVIGFLAAIAVGIGGLLLALFGRQLVDWS